MAGWPAAALSLPSVNKLLLVFACYLALCSAAVAGRMIDIADETSADSGKLLVDPRPAPIPSDPKAWTLTAEEDALHWRGVETGNDKRDEPTSTSSNSAHSTSKAPSSTAGVAHHTTASSITQSSSSTSSSAASLATQSSQPSSSPLPMPFDQGFAGDITTNCTNFVYGFLADPTFTSCLPFSLLLQNSESFFQAEKSVLSITRTLDATCAANVNTCTDYMNQLSSNMTKICASDIAAKNSMVLQAQLGLNAYNTLYTASCLRNPATSAYCFADAITNTSNPTDSYIYYLPLNISLPGGSAPTCNDCLINTMAVLEKATANRSTPIASDYAGAAQQINLHCGPGFVNASLAVAASSSIAGRSSMPTVELALVVLIGAKHMI